MAQARAHTFPGKVKVNSYIHKIYGYRYSWHDDMYEIDIVLRGNWNSTGAERSTSSAGMT